MALFELDKTEEVTTISGRDYPAELVNAASFKYFKSYLGSIAPGMHYHFWTGGQWSMHDLLSYLVTITGMAKVYITTYAISEDAVRRIIYLKENGLISDVQFVFDFTAKEQKTGAFMMAQKHFAVTLTRMHAKVCILENDSWKMIVTGSANWTRNPKAERQLLCTAPAVVDDDIAIVQRLAEGKNPFKVR